MRRFILLTGLLLWLPAPAGTVLQQRKLTADNGKPSTVVTTVYKEGRRFRREIVKDGTTVTVEIYDKEHGRIYVQQSSKHWRTLNAPRDGFERRIGQISSESETAAGSPAQVAGIPCQKFATYVTNGERVTRLRSHCAVDSRYAQYPELVEMLTLNTLGITPHVRSAAYPIQIIQGQEENPTSREEVTMIAERSLPSRLFEPGNE